MDIIAITIDQASKLTGLPVSTLRYWHTTGFFAPTRDRAGERQFSRIYSFQDIVGLRTIATLRDHGIRLPRLREVAAWLAARFHAPWATLRFYVAAHQVFVRDAESDALVPADGSSQLPLEIGLEEIATDVSNRLKQMRQRSAAQIGHVETKRNVMHNRPRIAGTWVPTATIWSFHQAGYSHEGIVEQYPHLKVADVAAAIRFEEDRRRKKTG